MHKRAFNTSGQPKGNHASYIPMRFLNEKYQHIFLSLNMYYISCDFVFHLQTYDEMEELISQSDGKSVDVYISDAVTKPKEGDVDAYNVICDDDYDIRLLPFGKGTENPGRFVRARSPHS